MMKWAHLSVIPDDADDATVEAFRDAAITAWRTGASRHGFPMGQPTATLERSAVPFYGEDPDTGQPIKLPERAWRIEGDVVEDWLMPDYVYRTVVGHAFTDPDDTPEPR